MRISGILLAALVLLASIGTLNGQATSPQVLLFTARQLVEDSDNYNDIFAYDLATDTLHRISPTNYTGEGSLNLAPDGQHLALGVATMKYIDFAIVELQVDGTVPDVWQQRVRLAGTSGTSYWGNLVWSPIVTDNIATLAYSGSSRNHREVEAYGSTYIWLVDVPLYHWEEDDLRYYKAPLEKAISGTARTLINKPDCAAGDLAWSPDGQRIAYVCGNIHFSDIYVQDVFSSNANRQRLTNNEFEDRHPTWSPDGEWIAFNSTRAGRRDNDIYKMNLITGEVIQLTTSTTDDIMPAWSPDGDYIAFGAGEMLALMKPDGTELQVLFKGWQPSWVTNPEWVLRAPQVALPDADN